MPTIDADTGALVIRLVYDGPPFSGKTTTLRALAHALGVALSTPAEVDGRTLFFDWMEYSGGIFDGRRIRCQLISVPGQLELRARRRAILESADAVVMVANTRAPDINAANILIAEASAWSQQHSPPIGLIVQANQRDAADCIPTSALRQQLCGDLPVAIVETVASRGEGVREAFVLAVRLALDRARDLMQHGGLHVRNQEQASSAALLAQLEKLEHALPAGAAQRPKVTNENLLDRPSSLDAFETGAELLSSQGVSSPQGAPRQVAEFVADPTMPGGFIWPPVHGRAFLHEVSGICLTLTRSSRGDWSASGEGWRVHSAANCEFESTDAGRPALIDWARVHATNGGKLSDGRVVILSPWGDNSQRLWQLVKIHQSLREMLSAAVGRLSPAALAEAFFDAAAHLHRARMVLNDQEFAVRCSLWTVSADLRRPPVYLGLMPDPRAARKGEPQGEELIQREFAPLIRSTLQERDDAASFIQAIVSRAGPSPREERQWVRQLATQYA